ncbi:autotransporter domain-containing protein [Ancylobacter sp. TS-1]|nr:autotransporter domain-containing protein [Ancylobacter sp. TS-1]
MPFGVGGRHESRNFVNCLNGSTALVQIASLPAGRRSSPMPDSGRGRDLRIGKAGAFAGALATVLAAAVAVPPAADAETLNGSGQAGFDTLIPQATQPGDNDTVDIAIGSTAGNVVIGSGLALPGAATGIQLNFLADPGTPAGDANVNVENGAHFVIGSGAAVDFVGNGRFNIGRGAGAEGSVGMTGGTLSLGKENGYSALNIGYTGSGSFTQSGGAVDLDGSAFQVGVVGGTGTYNLNGGSFFLTPASTVYLGEGVGGVGTLNVTGNAQFTTTDVVSGGGTQMFVGVDGGTGKIVQDGAGSLVSIDTGSNAFWFGWGTGGQGTYDLRAGTFNVDGTTGVTFGRDAGTSGTFLQSGGTFSSTGQVIIGAGGTGSYTLSGGTSTMNGGLRIASGAGTGQVVQSGGAATVIGGITYGSGIGSYELNGGTFTVDGITGGNVNSTFSFGGGTLIASQSFTTSSAFATSFDAASTIQVDGTDVLSWNSVISGTGGLTKTGTGTLSLGGDNSTYGGDVAIAGGTLALTNKNGIGIGNDVTAGAGTVFDLTALDAGNPGTGAGIVQIGALSGGGEVKLGDSFLVSSVGAGQSAAFSGTITSDGWAYDSLYGRFYKAGAGDLLINGSTMERGEATIIEGSMTQSAGTTNWSNINVGGDGGTGLLTVSGGTLTLNVGLRVGDFGGTGTVNQTGGTVQLEQSCDDDDSCASLNIGNQGGTGIYNISGGSLLLGGGSHSIGRNAGSRPTSSGTLNISGTGLVQLSPDISDGYLVIGDRDPGSQPNSTGVINQTGGTLRIAGSRLYLGGYGSGTYNLNGGTLEIGGASLLGLYGGGGNTTGSYDFNLGGGAIKVIGSSLTTSVDAELTGTSISTIDTNGFDATWNGTLSGTGSLRKSGEGLLDLTKPENSYIGDTYFAGGKLRAVDGALGAGDMIFEGTSSFVFASTFGLTNDVTLQSGVIGGFDVGGGLTGTLSGNISGAGGLAKTGLGTLVLDGTENTYSGATLVQEGTLVVASEGALSDFTQVSVTTGAFFELQGVEQSVDGLEGDGNVVLGAGSSLTVAPTAGGSEFSGVISGPGGLNVSGSSSTPGAPPSVLTLSGINDYSGPTSVDTAKLVVNGSIANSDVTVGEGGTLGGSGTVKSVTLTPNSTLAPGNSPGVLTVVEDVNFVAGSAYEVEFDGSLSDKVILQEGDAFIADDAELSLLILSRASLLTPYTIIEIADGSSGTVQVTGDGFEVTLNRPLLEALISYSSTSVDVTFEAIDAPWSSMMRTTNQGATANAVQSLGYGNPLFEEVAFLSDVQVGPTVDLLSGEIGPSAKSVLINDSQFLRSAVFDRLASADRPEAASGIVVAPLAYAAPAPTAAAFPVKAEPAVAEAPVSAIWSQAFGSWGSTDGNGNAASVNRDTGGFFIGADTLFGDWRLGVLGGYSRTSFDVNARSSTGDSDNYHAALYAGTNWGAVNLRAGAAYTWNDVSTSRFAPLPLPGTLNADYDAGTAQVFGELGYGMSFGAVDFEPFVGLAYVNLGTDAFAETGGLAALYSPSSTMDATYSTLGLRAASTVNFGRTVATLKGLLGWRHAFGDVDSLSTYMFEMGSTPFTVAGVPIAEDSLLVDVGMSVAVNAFVNVGIAYSGEFGDGSTDQSVRGSLDWKF